MDSPARASGPPRPAPAPGLDLACLGGVAAFPEGLQVGRPNLPDRAVLLARLGRVLDSRRLTNMGPEVVAFERRVADLVGAHHCVATCNATVGLELAIQALGMRGEVIVPSFTFVADAHALWWQGVRPVFCDVDPRTHCIDPERVEAALTPRTGGILGVHLWGNACDVDALGELSARHGLPLLYDAAHAFGATARGRPIGGFGHASVFSFHATKMVNAFEGGAIVTDDEELARRLRLMTNFGFSDEDLVEHLGVNGKMSEPSAAMGLCSLDLVDQLVAHNGDVRAAYARGLDRIPGLELLPLDPRERGNHQYVVVVVDAERAGLTRDELVAALRFENVMARRYFHPGCHRMEPYRRLDPEAGQALPVTEDLAERVMVLPNGQGVAAADAQRLALVLVALLERARDVRAALAQLAASNDPRMPSFFLRCTGPASRAAREVRP